MYTVSKEYKEAMKQPVQHFRIRGTLPINAPTPERSRSAAYTSENCLLHLQDFLPGFNGIHTGKERSSRRMCHDSCRLGSGKRSH